jgi:hypothetical protein
VRWLNRNPQVRSKYLNSWWSEGIEYTLAVLQLSH